MPGFDGNVDFFLFSFDLLIIFCLIHHPFDNFNKIALQRNTLVPDKEM